MQSDNILSSMSRYILIKTLRIKGCMVVGDTKTVKTVAQAIARFDAE